MNTDQQWSELASYASSAAIQIGWRDKNCPMDVPVTPQQVIRSDAITKARKHLAIERGAKYARKCASVLAKQLRRLAEHCGTGMLELHTTNQTTAPAPWDACNGLGIEVRYIPAGSQRIAWDIQLFSRPPFDRKYSYHFAIVPKGELHVMREQLVMVDMPRQSATYITQLLRAVAA